MPKKIELDLGKVEDLAAKFGSDLQIALALGVSHGFIASRRKADREFADALVRGKARFVPGDQNQSQDEEIFADLDAKILYAIGAKIFFLESITKYVGKKKELVKKRLNYLVDSGKLILDDSTTPPFYRLSGIKEIVSKNSDLSSSFYPENLSDGQVRDKILDAIDNLYCLLNQIKRFNNFPLSFDLSRHLEQLENESKIVQRTNEPLDDLDRIFPTRKIAEKILVERDVSRSRMVRR